MVSSIIHDSKVYITGLAEGKLPKDDVSRQVLVYSQHKGQETWSTLPKDPKQEPAPNYNAPVRVINGHISLVGGRDAESTNITDVLSTWNEEKHQWENYLTAMPIQRLESGVCHDDSLLLVVGGIVDDKEKTLVNTVDVYNFSSKRWSTPEALELPKALRSPQVALFKDYVYLIGGATRFPARPEEDKGHYNSQAWRAPWSEVKKAVRKAGVAVKQGVHTRTSAGSQAFKSMKGVWREIAPPPARRPTVVSCEDSLMLVGGVNKVGKPLKGIHEFIDEKNADGKDGRWSPVGSMSVGRYRHAAVLLGSRGAALLVAGGFVRDDPMGDEKHEKSSSAEVIIL